MYPIVFVIQKDGQKRDVVMTVMKDVETPSCVNIVPAPLFYTDTLWGRYFQSPQTLEILIKCNHLLRLHHFLPDISGAATVAEAYKLKELIHEYSGKEKRPFRRLLNTGTIDRYSALWSVRPTRYIKQSYKAPVVFDADLINLNITRLRQAQAQKIIIGGMTQVLECHYDEGEHLAGKSTVIILANGTLNLKYVVALLNSSFVSFWYRAYYNSLSLAGGYLRISRNEIKTIPVPKIAKATEACIISLVDRILAAKKRDPKADTTALEHEIDQLVYKLYDLTPEEIDIVEGTRK